VVGEKLVVGSAAGSVLAPVVVGAEAEKSRVGREEGWIGGGRNLVLGGESAIEGQTLDRWQGDSEAEGAEALAGEGAVGWSCRRWGENRERMGLADGEESAVVGREEFSWAKECGIGQRTGCGGGEGLWVEAGAVLDEHGVVGVAPTAGCGGGERQAGWVDEVDGIDGVVGEREGRSGGGREIGDIVEMENESGGAQGVGFRTAVVCGNPD